jgi:hypothetical protein
MLNKFNRFLDFASEYLAERKGLLPMIGIALVLLNAILQFIPGIEGLARTNLFLHLGVIVAILGFLLAWAL